MGLAALMDFTGRAGSKSVKCRAPEKLRGLYTCSARGKEELQEGADALRPGGFVVLCAFDALVMQIPFGLPALADEYVAEALDIVHNTRPFASADIQPDPRKRARGRGGGKSQDDPFVPPYRRR